MQRGPVRHTFRQTTQVEAATRRVLIERDAAFYPTGMPRDPSIQKTLSAVAADHRPAGGGGGRARRRGDELLASDRPRVVLATGRYVREGFDDPRPDTLLLAMPIAWKAR